MSKLKYLIIILLIQISVIYNSSFVYSAEIIVDSNCRIVQEYLDFFFTNIKSSYPNLSKYKDIGITHISFKNSRIDNIPMELKEFQTAYSFYIFRCDSNMSKLFEKLSIFPNLKYLKIEGCEFAKFPEKVQQSFNLQRISIVNCDSVYITKEFINKCHPKEIFIDECKAVTFEKGIVLDSIDSFVLYNNTVTGNLIYCRNLDDVLNSITKADFISILGFADISFPNNILESRLLSLYGSDLKDFEIPINSVINIFGIDYNQISVLPQSFYSHKGYQDVDISHNLVQDFRFDLLDTNTFKYKKGIDTVFEEGDSTKGIIEIIPADAYYPQINLSWNFLDSIRTFVDTSLNKSYRIYLNYNNRKLKSDSDGFDSLKYKEFNPEKLTFTLPKGIFNLQFRGRLELVGYTLTEEEKEKIRKHFKNVFVEFDQASNN